MRKSFFQTYINSLVVLHVSLAEAPLLEAQSRQAHILHALEQGAVVDKAWSNCAAAVVASHTLGATARRLGCGVAFVVAFFARALVAHRGIRGDACASPRVGVKGAVRTLETARAASREVLVLSGSHGRVGSAAERYEVAEVWLRDWPGRARGRRGARHDRVARDAWI